MSKKWYEVRVREIHTVIYTVEAEDQADAIERLDEDMSPVTVDAQVDEIVSVKEPPQ